MSRDYEQEELFPSEKKQSAPEKKPQKKDSGQEAGAAIPPRSRPARDHIPKHEHHGPLTDMVDRNFLQYASYVICERAIPSVEDGLKPVQRRILHSLHERDDGRFIKVANVVGHTMQYHPHGDASIGDALVVLANKEYVIEGQGNFGNLLTGDRAAAARYIECRLTDLARRELFNKDLTDYIPSYDGRNKEPVTLPAKLPMLLMLGAEGIAVGLSTRILPHNFIELLEAVIAVIQKKPFAVYPDLPRGGLIDVSEYDQGNGKIRSRARIEIESKTKLVITELPYATSTEAIENSIEDAVRKKKVPVLSIDDYTAEQVEIHLKLKPGSDPEQAIKSLYAFTQCENSVSCSCIVIKAARPCEMSVDEVIRFNAERLLDLLRRELEIARDRLGEEINTKTLVQIFIENRIYKEIEQCETYPAVQQAVLDGFKPFKKQLRREIENKDVEMLLGIPIKRISLFDINKNREDIEKILAELAEVEKNLKSIKRYATSYLNGIIKKYRDQFPRKSEITSFSEIELRELTAKELTIFHDAENGYIGTEVDGQELFKCSSLDKISVVMASGVYMTIKPPEKLFVDKDMAYCAKYDRDQVMTMVYEHNRFAFIKRFSFGGTILDKEYEAAPQGSKVLFFCEGTPEELYVSYRPRKNQRVHKQLFKPGDVAVKGARAKGNQLTAKSIARISTEKPRNWD
jgi:topoisomerase IV subunit A